MVNESSQNTFSYANDINPRYHVESLMSALSRVLREDGRKSMELVSNIIYIFFCFSNFSEFHQIITANKLGDMCLRIADQEVARYDLLVQDLSKLENKVQQNPNDRATASLLEKEHKKFQRTIHKQDQLLFSTFPPKNNGFFKSLVTNQNPL